MRKLQTIGSNVLNLSLLKLRIIYLIIYWERGLAVLVSDWVVINLGVLVVYIPEILQSFLNNYIYFKYSFDIVYY
jgi:hypothetical protein